MTSSSFIAEGALALALTAGLIILLRSRAAHWDLVDHPDPRKQHHGTIPLIGGPAMGLAFLVTMLGFHGAEGHTPLLLATALILLTGLLDDLHEMPVVPRFGLQIIAVLIMVKFAGVRLVSVGDLFASGPVFLLAATTAFTVFAVIGIINAINMCDGLDGYAGGITLVALVMFAIPSLASGHVAGLPIIVAAGGCVVGFLAFNLRHPWRARASVFMGDCGSMFLGFLLGWIAVQGSQTAARSLAPISAVWVLGLPILDTVYVMLRRMGRGRSPFEAGRDHLHYALVGAGMKPGAVVALLLAVSAVLGTVGVVGEIRSWPETYLFYGYLLVAGVYVLVQNTLERFAARPKIVRAPG